MVHPGVTMGHLMVTKGHLRITVGHPRVTREVMMGEGNRVASVIMLTFTKMPGPHADTAWAVVG